MSGPQKNMVALERATEVRRARAAVKRDLREGRISLADALEHEATQTMTVFDLLCAQYRWAGVLARKALSHATVLLGLSVQLPESKLVGSLTDRQKRALLQVCGCERKMTA